MFTLKELKSMVEVADMEKRVPTPKALRISEIPIVVNEVMESNSEVTVYANGYVLYRAGKRRTVFPLHKCTFYEYETVDGDNMLLDETFFDNENWYVRLIMEGTDLMVRNQQKVESNHGVFSYSDSLENGEILKDTQCDVLEDVLHKEMIEELLNCLSEKQKKVVSLYYFEGLNQTDISGILDISQQSVCAIIKRALKVMRKYVGIEE